MSSGHVQKKRGKWYARYEMAAGPDGERMQKMQALPDAPNKKQAEAALRDILQRLDQGTFVEPSQRTLASFLLDEWIPARRDSLKPPTFESYTQNIRLHVVPTLGATPLQKLMPGHLNRLYADLRESGRCDGNGGLSPRSTRYIHTIIRKALDDALKWGLVVRNVADAAAPPSGRRTSDTEMKSWTVDDLRTFLSSLTDDRLYAAWLLAATTGMRRGEILGLRWSDIDLDSTSLSVRQTLISVSYKMQFSTPKTERSRRTVALDVATVKALRTHRTAQLEERLAWGEAYEDRGLVFTRENGAPIHPDTFAQWFPKHVNRAGVPSIRFHDVRHTHASLALQAGVPVKVVSERLGHASAGFTLDVYAHVMPGMQAEAAKTVAALFVGP